MKTLLALAAACALAACATSNTDTPTGPPSLEIAAGQPAPPQARFYADCIVQSAQERNYDREGNVIRFHCAGASAQTFFDGLGPWSEEIGSEMVADNTTWRFSTRIQNNPSFADFCRREGTDAAARYTCTVVLNVGEFLAE